MPHVIGLISGTSVDGIDAALVEIKGLQEDLTLQLCAALTYAYPEALKTQILKVCAGASLSMAELAELDDAIAQTFAQAALAVQSGFPPADLIGSHGQTVYHRPLLPAQPSNSNSTEATSPPLAYSLQLGRGDLIAHFTGIPTVSNFRAADIAVGGQGAPMVPPIDACLFGHATEHRCIQNIGGIGNVTYLPAQNTPHWRQQVRGWDTGPGNSLIDLAVQRFSQGQKTYDREGAWAAQGKVCQPLLETWLQEPFFQQPPPKSTGRELFGWTYLDHCWSQAIPYSLSEADFLATLTELTAASIVHSYRTFLTTQPDRVLLCGGGSRNQYLHQRLRACLDPTPVDTIEASGISSDFKEAIAFAVLAYWHQQNIPGNLPAVTGASEPVVLGQMHKPFGNSEFGIRNKTQTS